MSQHTSNRIAVGIVSYLPDNEKLRNKRLTAHRKQLEYLEEVMPGVEVMIVAQNYENYEMYTGGKLKVQYMMFDEPIGPSKARNLLLQLFYKSGFDYLLMMDDDIVTYPYFNRDNFFNEIRYNPEKFFDLTMIIPLFPTFMPFKKLVAGDEKNNTHYKFARLSRSQTCHVWLKNIAKHHGKEIYFDETITKENGLCAEDFDFSYQLVVNGFTVVRADTIILKPYNMDDSVIFEDFKTDRLPVHRASMDFLFERYKEYGLKRKSNGNLDVTEFNKKTNKAEAVYYIPRNKEIDIFETLGDEFRPAPTPKQRKLF